MRKQRQKQNNNKTLHAGNSLNVTLDVEWVAGGGRLARSLSDTERQLVSKIAEAQLAAEQLSNANNRLAPVEARVRELELSLAEANAKAQAQEQIGEQLQAYLDRIRPQSGSRKVDK